MIPTVGSIKRTARSCMRASARTMIWTTLALFVITFILSYLVMKLSGMSAMMESIAAEMQHAMEMGMPYADYSAYVAGIDLTKYIPEPSFFETLLCAAISVMSAVISAGYCGMCLKVSRGKEAVFMDMFSSFDRFFRFLWLIILRAVFIFLWSLLFVIPGIIAAYRYSQAIFVMHDNPDLTARQCLAASSEMMAGHKLELFVLQLSFIGWHLLNYFVTAFIGVGLVQLWILPYTNVSLAVFYNYVSGYVPELREEPL